MIKDAWEVKFKLITYSREICVCGKRAGGIKDRVDMDEPTWHLT